MLKKFVTCLREKVKLKTVVMLFKFQSLLHVKISPRCLLSALNKWEFFWYEFNAVIHTFLNLN